MAKMNKRELERMLKPLIKECVKEVLFAEDGVLSRIIQEVTRSQQQPQIIYAAPPPPQYAQQQQYVQQEQFHGAPQYQQPQQQQGQPRSYQQFLNEEVRNSEDMYRQQQQQLAKARQRLQGELGDKFGMYTEGTILDDDFMIDDGTISNGKSIADRLNNSVQGKYTKKAVRDSHNQMALQSEGVDLEVVKGLMRGGF